MPTKKKPVKKPVARHPEAAKAPAKRASAKKHPKTPVSKAAIRRKKVAAAVVAGKSVPQIAEELDMSPDGVKEAKKHPDFPVTLAQLLEPHQEAYKQLFADSLATLKDLMGSGHMPTVRYGAVDRVLKIIEMTQPKGSNIFVGVTLEELERRVKEGA